MHDPALGVVSGAQVSRRHTQHSTAQITLPSKAAVGFDEAALVELVTDIVALPCLPAVAFARRALLLASRDNGNFFDQNSVTVLARLRLSRCAATTERLRRRRECERRSACSAALCSIDFALCTPRATYLGQGRLGELRKGRRAVEL